MSAAALPPTNRPKRKFGKDPFIAEPMLYVEQYLDELYALERTEKYIAAVRLGLLHLSDFLRKQEQVAHPAEITRAHLLHFQVYLSQRVNENGQQLAASYRQQQLKYVRNWLGWLTRLGLISQNPWVNIKIGTVHKQPKPLEDDDIAALFDTHRKQAFTISPFFFHRREVILVLLYAWGLRINELHSLTVTGMDARLEWVVVRNKGGGKKVLPYGEGIKGVISRWLSHRASKANLGVEALLIDSQGKPLSIHMIRKIVTDLGVRAGVKVNPHRLRDTFGTVMMDEDVEVERIMLMMGHTSRSQTLAYARVNNHKVKESHDRVMSKRLGKLLNEQRDERN